MNDQRFFIKAGYQSRNSPNYFEDTTTEKDGIIWQPEVYPLARHLARRLGFKRIIDLGCGRGMKLLACSPEFEVIGVDFGSNIHFCQQRHGVGKWVEWDFESQTELPLTPVDVESSVVVCSDVIEHLVNPLPLLDNLRRLLEAGGVAILSSPERDLLRGSADLGPPTNACHVREWNLTELVLLLQARGLRADFAGLTSSNTLNGRKDTSVVILSHPQQTAPEWLWDFLAAEPGAITAAGETILMRANRHLPYRVLTAIASPASKRCVAGLPADPALASGKRRRIAIASCEVMGPHRNGGIGTACTTLAETLAAAGHEVTLLDMGEGPTDTEHWTKQFESKGIQYVPLPASPFPLMGSLPMVKSYEAYQWLRGQSFEVIHFPEFLGGGYYSLLAKHQGLAFENALLCVETHSPSAWVREANHVFLRGIGELERDFMEAESVRLADVVISPSHYMLEWLQEHGWELPKNCFVQPNILPRATARASLPQSVRLPKVRELVFFGRLEERKGVELFCQTLDALREAPEMAGLTISFLGKSAMLQGRPSIDYIRQRAQGWPWPWQILSDYGQNDALEYLQAGARLAVIPSLMENLPYTVLECLGAGVPFIASRVGGIAELVAEADLAEVTFAPSPEGLAKRLRQVMSAGPVRARLAADAEANRQRWVAWHEAAAIPPGVGAASAPAVSPPLVSVCLCHHNRPGLLAQAIASLEAQDYPNFEVVLVDDGSREPKALKYLDELSPRFAQRGWQLFRQENRYLGAARNFAAQHAKGEYLLFMDDDNIAKPTELSTFVRVAQRSRADILTTCMDCFEGDAAPTAGQLPRERWLFLGAAASLGGFKNCFGDANALVRRDVFLAVGGFSEDRGYAWQDWEFWARATLQGFHLELVPEALFYYRVQAKSMSRTTQLYTNFNRSIRPYLEPVPASLRQMISFAQAINLRLEEMPPQPLPVVVTPSGQAGINRAVKRVLSRKWRRSFRKRLTTMSEWFGD